MRGIGMGGVCTPLAGQHAFPLALGNVEEYARARRLGGYIQFINSHHLEVSVPRLLEVGRKKDKDQGSNGALYWALAIKGSFLAMAYQGIAVMSGLALVMGKMALLLSAILGLKKLVSSNSQEATTLEIVKQPKYTEQHSYSDSYDDEVHHKP
ncbi:hypothetical protein NQ317_004372 [Molorchus minor]|uniref:Uncharacterized protein n=1 Tax=Molorchus minor TaxID=1323400 RepID=A0ABQ9J4I9_9CUCU|nr:hypothetical protein NQ317_004372 [Molorchus minor]